MKRYVAYGFIGSSVASAAFLWAEVVFGSPEVIPMDMAFISIVLFFVGVVAAAWPDTAPRSHARKVR